MKAEDLELVDVQDLQDLATSGSSPPRDWHRWLEEARCPLCVLSIVYSPCLTQTILLKKYGPHFRQGSPQLKVTWLVDEQNCKAKEETATLL